MGNRPGKIDCLYRYCTIKILLVSLIILFQSPCQAQEWTSDVGNFYPFLDAYNMNHPYSLSYLSKDWEDVDEWRTEARSTMEQLLAYNPKSASLDTEILETTERDGYTQYLLRYNLNAHQQTEAYLLIPDNLEEPAPAVVALHDHGGFYYFGKEKHNLVDDRPQILIEYIDRMYGGRTYADELAKRGYVVLSPDAIYFSSQRIDPGKISPDLTKGYFEKASGDINEKIEAFNNLAANHEKYVERTMLTAGTTWPGIIVQGDRRAVDLLMSRPEVDSSRIGVMGLSLGGLRTTYLFGMEPRVSVGIIAGFSSTYREMLQRHLRNHTWMMYVPRQSNFLDLPDIASLNAPKPLMIMNAKQDQLFKIEGMKAAEDKLTNIYKKMGAPGRFKANYYDAPHSMPIPMQEDAFEWLDRWLK